MQAVGVAAMEHHPDHPRLLTNEEDPDHCPGPKAVSAKVQGHQTLQNKYSAGVVSFKLRILVATGQLEESIIEHRLDLILALLADGIKIDVG